MTSLYKYMENPENNIKKEPEFEKQEKNRAEDAAIQLVIEENTIYEIDISCVNKKRNR